MRSLPPATFSSHNNVSANGGESSVNWIPYKETIVYIPDSIIPYLTTAGRVLVRSGEDAPIEHSREAEDHQQAKEQTKQPSKQITTIEGVTLSQSFISNRYNTTPEAATRKAVKASTHTSE